MDDQVQERAQFHAILDVKHNYQNLSNTDLKIYLLLMHHESYRNKVSKHNLLHLHRKDQELPNLKNLEQKILCLHMHYHSLILLFQ